MKQLTINKSRGLTLTELLAVMMIISLLATIAVPVFVARQEDARVRVAQAECREIAMAQEAVAAMHGFYVPFQLLDELPADPDVSGRSGVERIDQHQYAVGAAADTQIYLIIPTIRAEDQTGANQLTLDQGRVGSSDPNPLVRKLIQNWSGPFITWQRFWFDANSATYDGPSDPDYRDSDDMFLDFPLDPWGNPYRFWSPIGIVGTGNDEDGADFDFEDPNVNFSNGRLTLGQDQDEADRFQRYAVVSFGRDGISDLDDLQPADNIYNDIYYEFGTDGVSRNFGKF